ncbi:MAG: helix-turn-helix domain-containing protein [Candidatus Falkowbacteria bacterium]
MTNNFSNFYNTLKLTEDTANAGNNNDKSDKKLPEAGNRQAVPKEEENTDNGEINVDNNEEKVIDVTLDAISTKPANGRNKRKFTKKPVKDDNYLILAKNTQNTDTSENTPKSRVPLTKKVFKPIWLSVSESAKLGGVAQKTIRRALTGKQLKYKIVKDRYLIDLASVITFLCSNTKLKNKLNFNGIGQYVDIWRG